MLWGSYLILINILTFFLFGEDKKRAKEKKRRISERTLLFFAFFGGAFGALVGMYAFHHKTRKPKFQIGMPLLLLLQICVLYLYAGQVFFLLKIFRISFLFLC